MYHGRQCLSDPDMNHITPGIWAINKPKGPTSHDIINRMRKITGVKRVGHAGTLDPLASGVLVIGIGRDATKKLGTVVQKEKEYLATIRLGQTSTTDDEEGEKIIPAAEFQIPDTEALQNTLPKFVGIIQQVPPKFSAIKVNGQSAYRLARKGQDVNLKPRNVEIKEIEIMSYEFPTLCIRVVTGPGTYIRSLARDIGEALGAGAYLSDLVRTRVGEYSLEATFTVEEFAQNWLADNH